MYIKYVHIYFTINGGYRTRLHTWLRIVSNTKAYWIMFTMKGIIVLEIKGG